MTGEPNPDTWQVEFEPQTYPPIRLQAKARLSEHLTAVNSPVLFGCRTGICGTCRIRVEPQQGGRLESPSAEEAELLAIVCPNDKQARLACQLVLTGDLMIRACPPGPDGV
jgi:ferredoxin